MSFLTALWRWFLDVFRAKPKLTITAVPAPGGLTVTVVATDGVLPADVSLTASTGSLEAQSPGVWLWRP